MTVRSSVYRPVSFFYVGQFFAGLMSIAASLMVLFAFAWVARALLDARQLTWRRLLLAALAGLSVGGLAAALLVFDELGDVTRPSAGEFNLVAIPFTIIGTMGAVVVLELLFSRPPRSRRRLRMGPIRLFRKGGGIVRRALQVSRIAARHGLSPLLGLRRGGRTARSPEDLAHRARLALEEAGGMFIKLGQLLATRPDLVPPAVQEELAHLHSSAAPLPKQEVEGAIESELGRPVSDVFSEVDWIPLGSASIGQAHAARLSDGRPVVVKVRRPGLMDVVDRDLTIVRWLARMMARRTEWGRTFDVEGLAAEFSDSLLGELDFRIEARNLEEVAEGATAQDLVHVPQVHGELTSDGLLVMERLAGTPLSQLPSDAPIDRQVLADALCRSQVEAMIHGERFHGDPHPGNILVLDDGRLGLIDLGISGRLDSFEKAAVFQMLVAIHLEQPTLLYESMVSIGAIDPSVHDPDRIERTFAQFMAANLSGGLPPPEALIDLMRLTAELGLRLPRSTVTMFRALATLTGTLEHLVPDYPVIDVVADLGGLELRRRMTPGSAKEFVQQEWAELAPILSRLPRHLDRIATMAEHGRLVGRMRLFSEPEDRQFLQRVINQMLLTFLSIGTGVVSVMLLRVEGDLMFAEFTTVGLYEFLGWIGLFSAISMLLRVLLAVLRSETEARRR